MKRLAFFIVACAPLAVAFTIRLPQSDLERDRVGLLQQRLKEGKTKLVYEKGQGYLRSILRELQVDPKSQTLVFSKTSIQSDYISPKNPRALYFNEDTYVGWIPGAPVIEIMAYHPKQGIVFYTIPNEPGEESFTRQTTDCFRCHGGVSAGRAPSLLAESNFVGPSGYPRPFAGSFRVGAETAFKDRWGGWYVTGTHGAQRHMGNELAAGTDEKFSIDTAKGANVTKLDRYFNTKTYPTPHSDIVALMVAEHQMDVQNALARVSRQAQNLLRQEKVDDHEYDRLVGPLVQALIGANEVELTSPVAGTSGFSEMFASYAPKDPSGRSLSQFDLRTRMFRYGVSPLVYSTPFRALPEPARLAAWRRMATELRSGAGRLSAKDRQAAVEILKATSEEFARASAESK